MDHKRHMSCIPAKDHVDHFSVANIDIHVVIAPPKFMLEALAMPTCRGFLAKKLAAQIVVDADDVEPLSGEIAAGF